MSMSRIYKEVKEYKASGVTNVYFGEGEEGYRDYHLPVNMIGPKGTVFAGKGLHFSVDLPTDYPYKPPKITNSDRLYHPCVDTDGTVGLYYLKNWSPHNTIVGAMLQVRNMLEDPRFGMVKQLNVHRQFLVEPDKFYAKQKEFANKYMD